MSDLREQLLKMGLVSKADAEKAAPRDQKRREFQPRVGEDKTLVPPAPRQLSPEEGKKIAELSESGRWTGKLRGHRRWYYVSRREGLMPFLELSDEAATALERGELAIVETGRAEAWLVSREVAAQIAAIDPGWIRS